MNKKSFFTFVFVISSLILVACAAPAAQALSEPGYNEAAASSNIAKDYDTPQEAQVSENSTSYFESTDYSGEANLQLENTEGKRVVIMNADLSIVVADPSLCLVEIQSMAEEMGGFVVSSNLRKQYLESGIEVPVANITIRVPAENLNNALAQIKSKVENPNEDIVSEIISGQDVTKEYTDLKSRLANLESSKTQLEAIMQQADKTEDVLSIYRELSSVTEQIEVIKGQIKYYEESAALSAISIVIQSKKSVQPLTIGQWEPTGIAREAIQALINALKFFATAGIWIVIFVLPIGIIIAIPFVVIGFIVRYFSKRKKSKHAQKIAEAELQKEDVSSD